MASFNKLRHDAPPQASVRRDYRLHYRLDMISRYDIVRWMTRILADLPDEDIKRLDRIAAEQGKSRAAVLREAVAAYHPEPPLDWLEAGFGLWARHGITLDPHEYERQRRAEWTRPWDHDYEVVRAESPECFTEEDDRERAHYLALFGKSAVETNKDAA